MFFVSFCFFSKDNKDKKELMVYLGGYAKGGFKKRKSGRGARRGWGGGA